MSVLFTPVGKSDPMTIFENCDVYDAGYIHIIRHFKPQKVYLYMSKEICDYDELDNRYELAVQLLAKKLNIKTEVIKIKRESLLEVQKFDNFYEDFEIIISDIIRQNGEDIEILCNVSSGTPAMKAALQTLSALSKYKLTPVQVSDPSKGKYKREVDLKNYNINEYWNQNIDNIIDINRTYKSENDTFRFMIQKEILIKLINLYDYEGAYRLALVYEHRISKEIIELLKFAYDRYNLDTVTALKYDNLKQTDFIPYKTKEQSSLFEYALWMKIKEKKSEYLEFVKSLTPFLYESLKYALKYKCGIEITKYCDIRDQGKMFLKNDKLMQDELGREILSILNSKYGGSYNDKQFLSEDQLHEIFVNKSCDEKLKEKYNMLEKLRKKKRNIASHQITCITKDDFQKGLQHTSKEYVEAIKTILLILGFDVRKEWDSYERMNNLIIKEIQKIY